ncbi:MAG: hypothetical protein NC434_00095 [Ruminococcus sp.]|nr:hypothetical protein [Ruminococcus sp.]
MLLLKANPELKKVFGKLIKAMKLPVTWTDYFVITNNNLILTGEIRSLIFNFDHKKAYTTIMEIPAECDQLENMPGDSLLNNVMNMTLYSFGKWGIISGLKVDKDYDALNALFTNVLRPVNIEPDYNIENFRFFKNSIQITFEDVMLAVLKLLKEEGKLKEGQSLATSEIQEKQTEGSGLTETDAVTEDDYQIGLWHNLCWKTELCAFHKLSMSEEDTARSRIGRNFYITNYQCPNCGEKLYMGVYPVNREILIDTEEGRVFMARTYACHECNTLYTPRPQKLLQEGDVYSLKFDEDRTAYEDYLDLLGQKAAKTTNSKFNEFEADRLAKMKQGDEDSEETGRTHRETVRLGAVFDAVSRDIAPRSAEPSSTESVSAGSASVSSASVASQDIAASAADTSEIPDRAFTQTKDSSSVSHGSAPESPRDITKLPAKTIEELKTILTGLERQKVIINTTSEDISSDEDYNYIDAVRETLRDKLIAQYDAHMETVDDLPLKQLADLKRQIEKESVLPERKKSEYRQQIDHRLYKVEALDLAKEVENCKNKPYAEIEKVIRDVIKQELPEELKQETLQKLKQIKAARAKREVEHLLTHMPLHLNRKQLSAYMDKIDQYHEVDLTPYRKQLEERKDMAEKEEISAMINRSSKKDRAALWNLYEKLQEQDYKEENKAPFLEKIYDKVRMLDEVRIEKICPSMASLSFSEAMKAYNEISEGAFLPELKTNTLEMIRRRLTKLKTDESVQLMRKLKHDLEEKMINCERLYFYNAREELKSAQKSMEDKPESAAESETSEENTEGGSSHRKAMLNAVNGYASARDTYEYPLMICDISRSGNGKEGFVLTPDHIFYHTFLNSGKINIFDIDKIMACKKLFGKGIFIVNARQEKEKLPNNMKAKDLNAFARVLDDFIHYLQEKPESRSVEYMAKETHVVKCCYRCGFIYKSGNVCPKCGSKMNL